MSLIMPEDRDRMKTGSPLDKLEALIPTSVPLNRPGPRRHLPVQCCGTCKALRKKTGDRYECHPKGSWFIKEIRGGEISIKMPHMKPCWTPTVKDVNEHFQDPWNATSDAIQDFLMVLERNLNHLTREGIPDDWTTEDNPI